MDANDRAIRESYIRKRGEWGDSQRQKEKWAENLVSNSRITANSHNKLSNRFASPHTMPWHSVCVSVALCVVSLAFRPQHISTQHYFFIFSFVLLFVALPFAKKFHRVFKRLITFLRIVGARASERATYVRLSQVHWTFFSASSLCSSRYVCVFCWRKKKQRIGHTHNTQCDVD